ncbi:MAG TPA: hypothetical protein VGP92_06235, partial [Acidimicrobiia bacterium]|nr:hypothetical protein [Acidimicrobiia bacterium]
MAPIGTRSPPSWGWFVAWLFAGAACALALLSALTIGIFVLPFAGAAVVFLATRRGATDGVAGLISGLGLPVLYVAYLNRNGPGDICTHTATSSSCTQESSPWVWFSLGVALVVVGVVLFVRRRPPR